MAVPIDGFSEPPPDVRVTRDPADVLPILEASRLYAATAYAFLEPRLSARTTGYIAEQREGYSLLLSSSGSPAASLYCQGAVGGLAAILRDAPLPRYSYITYEARHQELLKRHFMLRDLQSLARMSVTSATFQSVPSPAIALEPVDIGHANALYRSGGGVPLSQQYLKEGQYYGVWEGEKLVSIAGTQLLSEKYGVAVVANVFTHQSYRNRGYATQCVSALTEALLAKVPDVVLNVDPENAPAVRAYRKLGYQEQCRLAEAWAIWKGRSLFDRLLLFLYDWLVR